MNAPTTPTALTRGQLKILSTLMTLGPCKALFFDEEELDDLFKRRPRLIAIRPGHIEAVVEVTAEGLREFTRQARAAP